ncbi:MAG: ubiquitin-conjugating enzyme E2 variant [Janthinobacterium lividum]
MLERRLANEWILLQELADRNPGRMTDLSMDGSTLTLRLHGPAASYVGTDGHLCLITSHAIRVDFPVHFPAVPMEMFLAVPVFHPNIHPETCFVCLWDRHRVSNTVEHAMHKLVAMLAGELQNTTPLHVMQPLAVEHPMRSEPMPLLGVPYDRGPASLSVQSPPDTASPVRRRRLQ